LLGPKKFFLDGMKPGGLSQYIPGIGFVLTPLHAASINPVAKESWMAPKNKNR